MFAACFGSSNIDALADAETSPRVAMSPPLFPSAVSPVPLSNNQSAFVLKNLALVNEALNARNGILTCHLLSELCFGESEDSQPGWVRELISRCVGRAHLLLGDMCKNHFLPVETLFQTIPNEPMVVAVIWHARSQAAQQRESFAEIFGGDDDLANFKELTEADLAHAIQSSLDIPISLGVNPTKSPGSTEVASEDGLSSYPITFLRCRPRSMATNFVRDYHAELVMLANQVTDEQAPPSYLVDRLKSRKRTYFVKRLDATTSLILIFPRSVFDRPDDGRVQRFFDMCSSFFAQM